MKRCVALFNDGWADWEAGPVLAALREHLGWAVAIATPEGKDAESIGGIRAHADLSFSAVKPDALDLLLVIGSDQWGRRENPEVLDLIRRVVAGRKPLGAICMGTVVAARAGVLDTRFHTGNSLNGILSKASSYQGAGFYRDVPFAVSDQGVVTACGEAPMTFAAEILRLVDPERGPGIAAEFVKMVRAEHG